MLGDSTHPHQKRIRRRRRRCPRADALEVIQAEDRLHDKLARAEHTLHELIEAVRQRNSGVQHYWMVPMVVISMAVVGIAAMRCMTGRAVRRVKSEPVLGGFSPVSGKGSKKAW